MNEIGFIEDFSLSDDRAAALEKLIQGTEDYYYYHCLHFLNTGNLDQADDMLEQWTSEYGRTDRVERIEHRKALLEYPDKKDETISYIKDRIGIYFNHEKDVQDAPSHLSEELDQNLISRKSYEEQAESYHGSPSYINGYFGNLDENCEAVIYGSISNDEPLVRDFFDHIFPEAKDYKKYLPFVDDQYLKERFATAKLLNGIGDMKQWYRASDPSCRHRAGV